MKNLLFLFVVATLLIGGVACTREKPPAPTPTLVNQPILPAGATPGAVTSPVVNPPATSGAGSTVVVPNVTTGGTTFPTATLPPNFSATAGPPPALTTPTVARATAVPPAATAVPPTAAAAGGCSNPYTVQPGDWAYQIARKCGITFNQLQAANPGVDLSVVRPGQKLRIP